MVVGSYRSAGRLRVLMVPLTTRDYSPAASIPLPPRFIEAFGLDDRSRIVWDDVNDFAWVGPDVRAGNDGSTIIAEVPSRIVQRVAALIVEHRITPPGEPSRRSILANPKGGARRHSPVRWPSGKIITIGDDPQPGGA